MRQAPVILKPRAVVTSAGTLSTVNNAVPGSIDLNALGYRDYMWRRTVYGTSLQKTGRPFGTYNEVASVGQLDTTAYTADVTRPTVTATDWVNIDTGVAVGTFSDTKVAAFYNNGGTPSEVFSFPSTTSNQFVDILWGSVNDTSGFGIPGTAGIGLSLRDGSATPVTLTATAAADQHFPLYWTRITFKSLSASFLDITVSMAGFAMLGVIALV